MSLDTGKLVFGFSLKDILQSDGKCYKDPSNPEICFRQNEDGKRKENSKIGLEYCLKTTKCSLILRELFSFEGDLVALGKNVIFYKLRNNFH